MSPKNGNRPGEGAEHSVGKINASEITRQPPEWQAPSTSSPSCCACADELDLARSRREVDALIDRNVELFRKLKPAARTWLIVEVIHRKIAALPN